MKEEAIQVEAVPVETDVLPLNGAERWLATKRDEVAKAAEDYAVFPVTDSDSYKLAKAHRGQLNKIVKGINDERIGMVKGINEAVRGFKAAADVVAAPLAETARGLDANVKAYESHVVNSRMDMLRKTYEDMAPFIALPPEGHAEPLVPFELVVEVYGTGRMGEKTRGAANGTKWRNFGTSDELARTQLEEAVGLIADGERYVDEAVPEEDRDAVKALYFSTLDVEAAKTEAERLKAQRERLAAMEAERAALREPVPEPEPTRAVPPVPTQPPVSEPVSAPSFPWVVLIDSATHDQARAAGRAMHEAAGITGTFRTGTLAEVYSRAVMSGEVA